jgi:4-diphosphocytidyl-2-C-methyl-D-erythritol kinase
MRLLIEKAKAKINLTLDVLFKRPDGFHEVEMVMQTVDLCDQLTFQELAEPGIHLSCNVSYIPLDERNLVYKATRLLMDRFNIERGVKIHIEKRIPVAAGLAGGSSDAAATLRGLNRMWELGLSQRELEEIGAEIGSDVPFCVQGGTAIARGRGEKLERLSISPRYWAVLVKPPISVSTAEVYRKLNVQQIGHHPSAKLMVDALSSGDIHAISERLGNVLETVTFSLYPEVERIKQQLLRFGAAGALMSGSGPTVFALTDRESKAARIYDSVRGFSREVYVVRVW